MDRASIRKLCYVAQLIDLIRQTAKREDNRLLVNQTDEVIFELSSVLDTTPVRLLKNKVNIIYENLNSET